MGKTITPVTGPPPKPKVRVPEAAIKSVVLQGRGIAGVMLKLTDDFDGVITHRITPDGMLGKAGLVDGDVILFINGQACGCRRVAVSTLGLEPAWTSLPVCLSLILCSSPCVDRQWPGCGLVAQRWPWTLYIHDAFDLSRRASDMDRTPSRPAGLLQRRGIW